MKITRQHNRGRSRTEIHTQSHSYSWPNVYHDPPIPCQRIGSITRNFKHNVEYPTLHVLHAIVGLVFRLLGHSDLQSRRIGCTMHVEIWDFCRLNGSGKGSIPVSMTTHKREN